MGLETETIIQIIENVIGHPLAQTDNLLDDGVLDSLSTVMIIAELERIFTISIPTDKFSHFNFNSVDNMKLMIEELKN